MARVDTDPPNPMTEDLPGRDVVPTDSHPLRAVIGPHAGYSYCGHVMAHAYKFIDPERV
jgi:AmmeMemoRadiSam system protein B